MAEYKSPHIKKIASLKGPLQQECLSLLQDLSKDVSYLMKQYKLKVGSLQEFYPKDKRLLGLNINHGQVIKLRLRYSHDEFSMMSREAVLDVLLHELTHNWHGKHDSTFYNKLDELRVKQWVNDQNGNYDSFTGKGNKLGKIPGSRKGQRLGGNSDSNRIDPRKMAALAAERRHRDRESCKVATRKKEDQYNEEDDDLVVISINNIKNVDVIDLT